MKHLKPYLGQMVLFMPNPKDEVAMSNRNEIDYVPAIITRIWSEKTVNLKIVPDCGPMQDRTSVSHISNNPAGYHFIYITPNVVEIETGDIHLVEFGNYLLSKLRNDNVSEQSKQKVTDADLRNWKQLSGIE